MKKRFAAFLLTALMLCSMCLAPAAATEKFIDNTHWIETTGTAINRKYNNGDSFVVMGFTTSCFNSGLRKVMLDEWMDEYGIDIYGVDIDEYSDDLGSWFWYSLENDDGGFGGTLPFICIVENKSVSGYTGDDSLKVIQARFNEFAGIYDDKEFDFRTINSNLIQKYVTDSAAVQKDYLKDSSEISKDIAAEAKSIIAGCSTDMKKLKAIYDWVTENIYYDYGMLEGIVPINASAEWTYSEKQSVCSGYANLTAALCWAAGIPCRVVTGYATGVGSDETIDDVWALYSTYLKDKDLTTFLSKADSYQNHAWNEAFVNGRWVIMDTTWGSNNDAYVTSTTPYVSYGMIQGIATDDYFDMSVDTLSQSHLIISTGSADNFGDITGDNQCDNNDLTALARHLAKIAPITESVTLNAADINSDGAVTAADLTAMAMYMQKNAA